MVEVRRVGIVDGELGEGVVDDCRTLIAAILALAASFPRRHATRAGAFGCDTFGRAGIRARRTSSARSRS